MSKTVVDNPNMSEFEKIRLHNLANMYVNIKEDEGVDRANAYLAANTKNITLEDVKPFILGVMIERGYIKQ